MTAGNKVTLAFYRDGKSTISSWIRRLTGSHYSHAEIIVGSVWVSALIGQGVVARRYIPGDHKEKYDFIDVDVDPACWHDAIMFINGIEKDKHYDFLGAIFGSMLKIPFIQDPNKYYCSEVVGDVLKVLCDEKIEQMPTAKTTPQMLYDLYKDK